MRVWIVNPYGGLPSEGWRAYRSTLIARALDAAGHDVVWWVSNFDHRSKTYRTPGAETRRITDRFTVEIVPTPPYRRHISVARIRYEHTFASRFATLAARHEPPDVLILAEPAIFTGGPVAAYLRGKPTRLVIDVIDLWPELFNIVAPLPLRPAFEVALGPLRAKRARLIRRAAAVVAVSRDYLDIVPPGFRGHTEVVYWGVDVHDVAAGVDAARARTPTDRPVAAVYAGTLGDNYDIRTILDAATLLQQRNVPLDIHIAGAGPLATDVTRIVAERSLSRVHFLGSLDATALADVYGRSDIALSSYVRGSTVSMPIKAYDYLAAGLALVNSLERDLGRFVREREVGLQYEPQNAPALAAVLERLVTDHALRDRCRANASALAQEFDVERQYGKFVRLIEALVV